MKWCLCPSRSPMYHDYDCPVCKSCGRIPGKHTKDCPDAPAADLRRVLDDNEAAR